MMTSRSAEQINDVLETYLVQTEPLRVMLENGTGREVRIGRRQLRLRKGSHMPGGRAKVPHSEPSTGFASEPQCTLGPAF